MSLRLAFAGTPEFAKTILSKLLNTNHEMLAVLTQADKPKGRGQVLSPSPVKLLALEHHIPIYQPINLKNPDIIKVIEDLTLDCLIVVAYGMLIPKSILNLPKYGCINVHASLLPKYRGASPIQHAILKGEQQTGITIMQMDVGLDTGDMLSQYSCVIENEETSETLHNKLQVLGAKALLETLYKLERHEILPEKQDETVSSYAPKINKEDAKINWQDKAIDIEYKIRAFNPWPVAHTTLNGQTIRIWQAKAIWLDKAIQVNKVGSIVNVDKNFIDVLTPNGIIRLIELQLPGGKRLSVNQILLSKANLFQVGNCFES